MGNYDMTGWPQVAYTYDGTFDGFLTCVYESYVHHERAAAFSAPGQAQLSLYPERPVDTHPDHAKRVRQSLPRRLSPQGARLVVYGFLTALPDREQSLYDFLALGFERGPSVLHDLTDQRVFTLDRAVRYLTGEAHLLKGFIRFSDRDGVLTAEIEPRNRVLPLLRPHFCARYPSEAFVIYDRTHREALFYRPGQWAIVPLDDFRVAGPDKDERDWRALWRQFYRTVSIEGRYNPRCRMSHMPKRYWGCMTEFQTDPPEDATALPGGAGGL